MAYTPIDWAENKAITVTVLQNLNDEIVRLGQRLNAKISVQSTQPTSPSANQLWLWKDIAKRWTGSTWVNITTYERWTGSTWVDLDIAELFITQWEDIPFGILYDYGKECCTITFTANGGIGGKETSYVSLYSGDRVGGSSINAKFATSDLSKYNRAAIYFTTTRYGSSSMTDFQIRTGSGSTGGNSLYSSTDTVDYLSTPLEINIGSVTGDGIYFYAKGETEDTDCEPDSGRIVSKIYKIKFYNV